MFCTVSIQYCCIFKNIDYVLELLPLKFDDSIWGSKDIINVILVYAKTNLSHFVCLKYKIYLDENSI